MRIPVSSVMDLLCLHGGRGGLRVRKYSIQRDTTTICLRSRGVVVFSPYRDYHLLKKINSALGYLVV